MTPVTAEQLAKWRALADAATEGPWQCRDSPEAPFDGTFRVLGKDRPLPEGVTWQKDNRPVPAECAKFDNAVFIAAARTAVPALLAEVERLRELIYRLSDALTDKGLARLHDGAARALPDVEWLQQCSATLPEEPADG